MIVLTIMSVYHMCFFEPIYSDIFDSTDERFKVCNEQIFSRAKLVQSLLSEIR